MTWNTFKTELHKRNVFSNMEYLMFDKLIEIILNPAIRRYARNGYVKYLKTYDYRVGE